jgi:uncharacterized protein (DUF1330 family)
MPTGVYERTEENKRTCFKKGQAPWNKGMTGIYSDEYREKISEGAKGNRSAWKGGRYISWNGYVLVYRPEHPYSSQHGYVREHRLVVEKIIGRYLLQKEEVHHLGEKSDNRPHMLMAFRTGTAHRKFQKGFNVADSDMLFDGRKLGGSNENS